MQLGMDHWPTLPCECTACMCFEFLMVNVSRHTKKQSIHSGTRIVQLVRIPFQAVVSRQVDMKAGGRVADAHMLASGVDASWHAGTLRPAQLKEVCGPATSSILKAASQALHVHNGCQWNASASLLAQFVCAEQCLYCNKSEHCLFDCCCTMLPRPTTERLALDWGQLWLPKSKQGPVRRSSRAFCRFSAAMHRNLPFIGRDLWLLWREGPHGVILGDRWAGASAFRGLKLRC